MTHRWIVLAALALLAGCKQPATDGYRFESPEYERDAVLVRVATHRSLAELRAAAPASAHEDGRALMAWAEIAPDRASCTIHIISPTTTAYAPEWLGHELAHCLYGRWHR